MKGVKCEVANGDNIDAAFKGIFPLKLKNPTPVLA